jgi:adenine-specific DNA methylase
MAQESPRLSGERKELPIERGFPIERINEIAEKEGRAKQWYRPIYTMHKWWARRPGCLFRAISLYSLLDDPEKVEVYEPGENGTLGDYGGGHSDIENLIENVNMADPESLWELYTKDVRIGDKKILDPFMGGGTSLVEASRFGAESDGYDLNPVAWFISKKQIDAGHTDVEQLETAFEQVKSDVADEVLEYYKTACPHGDHDADVMYNFWAKEIDCRSCGHTIPLHQDFRIGKGRYDDDDKYNVLCPDCESIFLVDDWHEECECTECGYEYVPEEGNVDYGDYICSECGQKYSISEQIGEGEEYNHRLYAVEYYCSHCDDQGASRAETKGYKPATEADKQRYRQAKEEWRNTESLHKFAPSKPIRTGWKTDGREVDGSMPGKLGYGYGSLPRHGIDEWSDMYNERQLLCLSKVLESIGSLEDQNVKEFLLLTLSGTLRTNSMMVGYDYSYNKIVNIFKSNSFDPPRTPCEGNLWGTKYGRGTFESIWDMVKRGVEYATSPTERYVEDGETHETGKFNQPIGQNTTVHQGDMRLIDAEDEYDAVITDPPYYNNVLYSELSDFFYVWLKPMLEEEYDCFEPEHTPRAESIVVNPAANKGIEEFESELKQAFSRINTALKDDGVIAFTYHHSDSESWGELLEALCETGFEVTAAYPIDSDLNKFMDRETVSFDIVIVARPTDERQPISWNSLRRNIVRTAKQTHQRLVENRELSDGNIGVIEMGRAFHEYSKHHGEVQRDGEIMSAKEVVDEIYGIIQQGSDIGEVDVFLDLLEMDDPTYSDLNMLTRGTSANPDTMKDNLLYRKEAGEFILGTWDDQKRQAFIQERVNGDGDNGLTPLDKAQFLRHRYEQGKSIQNYLEKWTVSDDLRELCGELAEASGDDVYNRVLGGDRALGDY